MRGSPGCRPAMPPWSGGLVGWTGPDGPAARLVGVGAAISEREAAQNLRQVGAPPRDLLCDTRDPAAPRSPPAGSSFSQIYYHSLVLLCGSSYRGGMVANAAAAISARDSVLDIG